METFEEDFITQIKMSQKFPSIFSGIRTRGRHKKINKLQKSIRRIDSALKNKSRNDRDPITMELICDCAPIFSVVTEAGHKYSFDAKNLLNYVLVSGKVQNPITRDPFNDIEAHRLAKLCNYRGALDAARPDPNENDHFLNVIFGELCSLMDQLVDFCASHHTEELIAKQIIDSMPGIEDLYNIMLDSAGLDNTREKINTLLMRLRLLINNNNAVHFNVGGLRILENLFSKTILSVNERWERVTRRRLR